MQQMEMDKRFMPRENPDHLLMEDSIVKNPICRRFFFLFRVIGTILTVVSVVADYTYLVKQTFSSKELFVAYICVLAFRCLNPLLVALRNLCIHVFDKE